MKPARQRIGTRGERPRERGVVVTRKRREGQKVGTALIALQDSNCTTVGGEFDLGEALTNGAPQGAERLHTTVECAVGVGLEKRGCLIVHGAHGGLRFQVEGVIAGETHFHKALAALHGIQSGADEISIEKDVSIFFFKQKTAYEITR